MVFPLSGDAVNPSGKVVLFGKLPAHGDFIARGLTAGDRTIFDDWLSASLADAREALGDRFDECFDAAPPWRYRGTGAGALAASQDAAGRRFPALLIVEDGDDAAAQACEDLLYSAIGEGWSADRLAEAAASLDAGAGARVAPGWSVADSDGTEVAALAGARPPGLIRAMLALGLEPDA